MALVTPILAVLIAGIVEIGWYANHVLILQEVARVGARAGTVLSGDFDPGNWTEAASRHQDVLTHPDAYNFGAGAVPPEALNYRNCDVAADFPGFYNFIACLMLDSMDPLILRDTRPEVTHIDDIVISTFSLMAINNGDYTTVDIDENPGLRRRTQDFDSDYPNGVSMVVVGRYPVSANECTEDATGPLADPPRDPFNYIVDGSTAATNDQLNPGDVVDPREYFLSDGNQIYVELEGWDNDAEYQRGFIWLAQHKVESEDVNCWGSEWSDEEVATLLNVPSFIDVNCAVDPAPFADATACNAAKAERREFLPSQGLTLVEIFWEHRLLLDFPFLNAAALGAEDGVITISTWSAFPLPSTEPNIYFRSEG
jgi:hypothetical protein